MYRRSSTSAGADAQGNSITRPAAEKFESFNWIRGVADDGRLTAVQRLVLIRLCMHRKKTGECNPGYETLAKELKVARASVFRAINIGVACGWLAGLPDHGGRARRNFVFSFPSDRQQSHERDGSTVSPERRSQRATVSRRRANSLKKGPQQSHGQRGSKARSTASTRNGHLTGKEERAKYISHDPPDDVSLGDDAELAAGFDEFFRAYPEHRRLREHEARIAYCAAIRRGDGHAMIMRAVKIYAITERARLARQGKPECTRLAKNWLNGRCYNDPTPPGVVIDEQGAVVAIEPQPQRREETPTEMVARRQRERDTGLRPQRGDWALAYWDEKIAAGRQP